MLLPILATTASLALAARCAALEARAKPVIETTLYAYGAGGIGGLPIVRINDSAYISEQPMDRRESNVQQVYFTFTNGTLTALTDNEELLLGIPISGDVQFTKDRNDAYLITTGFGWYGQSLYASSVSGQVQILFGAEPTEEAGIYRIGWNVTGAAPLDIRYNKPSGHRNLY